ncbi:bifunctional glutamate N-acetyltransferase/amino-acid acetyltransferase ArgJ [Streptomyces avicenniae]|uniref:bifunctional glutamate N-acetyltransferase/amino-acid acetyltransferase ArgJ n=1 Tax=Streptomyces avicenniae TaxID=500153 RepID=UPI0006993723|nr:bifunctional glutamate N-acetyltransferase/amino-acid acetyltransferase ArgJ [Streptomyces avicenniae]
MSNSDAVEWPAGFRAFTAHAGLRDQGDDLSVIVSDLPSVSAAMFTRSRFAGPSVVLSRRHAAGRRLRAVVTLAKNANVATGAQGAADAAEVVAHVADALGLAPDEVLISSTGVIGRPLPMDPVRARLTAEWGPFDATPLTVARAMMTTDTRPKTAERAVGGARIVGVAKGVGMIEPDMATMLAYLATDALVTPEQLDAALRAAVDETFNSLSIDTDTSTSDTVAILANGAAGPVAPDDFAAALRAVCLDLAEQLARDGEGASKLLRVTVEGARDREQAKRIAKSVVNSPLVKTAVHGADPNWGRVVMAIGKNADDTDIDQEKVAVRFGAVEVYPAEQSDEVLAELTRVMSQDEVEIGVTLGIADGRATVLGCDLTDGYIRINADYTT